VPEALTPTADRLESVALTQTTDYRVDN